MLEGYSLKVSVKDSEYRNSSSRSFTPSRPTTYPSPPALHLVEAASQQVYTPYGHGYMLTPPSYGYGGYYAGPYTSPWGYNWGNGYAYAASPPIYHGAVAAAPTPNPIFSSAYPNQVDYSSQSYPETLYTYQPYAPQGTTVATAPAQQYQTSTQDGNAPAEEQSSDAQ
jgi:hypothetical protein